MGIRENLETLSAAVDRERLLKTARRLIDVPSPTCDAGAVSDTLAEIFSGEGFEVERVAAGWEKAPAVVVRLETGKPGRTMQFDGHLDTVHLPFKPSAVEGNRLTGSGASDMKAGVAAAVEAVRILRDTHVLPGGGVLFTAHDLHEAPWGDTSQLNNMIEAGIAGEGVLIPEYTHTSLPVIGRGNAVMKITVSRPGPAVHEVFRPADEPNVLQVGAKLVQQFADWEQELSARSHPVGGCETAFLGQFHCGEIYNQAAADCRLEGMRRWLPGHAWQDVQAEYQELLRQFAEQTNARIDGELMLVRDAFKLDANCDLVHAFQGAHEAVCGAQLPTGAKPFADDGSCFWQLKRIPAITHGPQGGGAHTVNEWVDIDDLVRVATVYAATAVAFCGPAA